jgi:hypothetical protein
LLSVFSLPYSFISYLSLMMCCKVLCSILGIACTWSSNF